MQLLHVLSVSMLLLVLPSSVSSQEAQPLLHPGTRVQVTIPDEAAQRQSPFRRAQLLRGDVTRMTNDTIYVRPAPQLSELAIPLAEVVRLDVSRGTPSRTASAVRLGIEQAIGFALAGALLYEEGEREFGVTNRGEAAGLGAGFGFLGGAIIGAIAPFERWKRVAVPARR